MSVFIGNKIKDIQSINELSLIDILTLGFFIYNFSNNIFINLKN